jgi:hypothetical protein
MLSDIHVPSRKVRQKGYAASSEISSLNAVVNKNTKSELSWERNTASIFMAEKVQQKTSVTHNRHQKITQNTTIPKQAHYFHLHFVQVCKRVCYSFSSSSYLCIALSSFPLLFLSFPFPSTNLGHFGIILLRCNSQ